jgi:hypothetical protein
MGFPTQLLEGHPHLVLNVTDDEAKLLVFMRDGGFEGLAIEIARRCPSASVSRVTRTHYTIAHPSFQGDLQECALVPRAALLEVRAPDSELHKAFGALPAAVGRYVLSETGNPLYGLLAGLGTVAVVSHIAPLLSKAAAPRTASGRTRP